jgi:phenylacetic acid degradation operon negative regulatory protein
VQAARIVAILDRLGVGRAAQRTALSRLVADGWIMRAKDPADGRAAIYRFSDSGRAEVLPAARLVYAAPDRVTGGDWVVAQSRDARGIPLGPGVGLWPAAFPPRDHGLTLRGRIEHVPRGFAQAAIGADQTEQAAAIRVVARRVRDTPFPADLDAMAARTVLIHHWRRYVLRYPEWPAPLVPADWPGRSLRAEVAAAYRAVLPASSRWLAQGGRGVAALPPDTAGDRFT